MKTPLIWNAMTILIIVNLTNTSWAWHDRTHIAIAQAAGYRHAYNAAGADMAKIKAGTIEQQNHHFNNEAATPVTAQSVLNQVARYNDPGDEEGHLYGAIIGSLREYERATSEKKYAQYHVAFAVHYIGDLSQPLHNTPYDEYNRAHHLKNDGIVEEEVLDNIEVIQKHMYVINMRPDHFDEDLAAEIARIANLSRVLGLRLKAENREMTREEAYTQLGHSASLLKAVLRSLPNYSE